MTITAEMVNRLRDKSSCPLMECKHALEMAGGSEAYAEELLRLPAMIREATARGEASRDKVTAAVVNSMRRELNEFAYGRRHMSPGGASIIANQATALSEREGLSGEDKYVLMAHMAIKALEIAQKQLVDLLNVTPGPIYMQRNKETPT